MDLSIHRNNNNNNNNNNYDNYNNNNNLQLGIYRKPTQTHTTIHFTSKHPLGHKIAACNFYINRMLSTTITEQARQREWNTTCTQARNNGFPLQIIRNLKNKWIKTENIKYSHTNTKKEMDHIYVSQYTHTQLPTCSKVPT